DVAVDLEVLLGGADVDPVAAVHVGGHVVAAAEEGGEEGALDRVVHAGRHQLERRRLQHVDAGVDRVGGDLLRGGLFDEAAHAPVPVGLDQPVGGRVGDGREHERGRGPALAMPSDDGGQVHVGEHVAVEHHGRVVEIAFLV